MTTTITITTNDKNNPPGKVADAELHFSASILDGLKLIGFGIWTRRGVHAWTPDPQTPGHCRHCDAPEMHHAAHTHNVTFPARQYSVNGERRSFALLRPSSFESSAAPNDRIRDLIVDAYRRTEQHPAITRWTYDDAGQCTTATPEAAPLETTTATPTAPMSLF